MTVTMHFRKFGPINHIFNRMALYKYDIASASMNLFLDLTYIS